MNKDVVYIDVDEEITGIIHKVKSSKEKIVALVLPKRAAVLQSIVNMKLLKRAGEESQKRVVLITSESGLLPLAGAAGLYVAKSLQSKPAIPILADRTDLNDDEAEEVDVPLDKSKPVGELAGGAAAVDSDEIDLSEEPAAAPSKVKAGGAAAVAATAAKAVKPNKKLKVPNFDRFRSRLVIGSIAAVFLIVLLFWAFLIAPKATVAIKTDNTTVQTNLTFTADPKADELDAEDSIVPARQEETKKNETQKVPATGQKDVGTKATGSVTLSLSNCSADQISVPAGTGVSSNNMTYITQEVATLNSVKVGNQCRNGDFPNFSSKTIKVVAQNAGEQYNIGAGKNFSVSGYSAVSGTNNDSMSGGTSKVIKVVSSQDVESAKQKLASQDSGVQEELKKNLERDDYRELSDTFSKSEAKLNVSPAVGEEASEVTVTSEISYTFLGVKKDALKALVETDIKKQIDEQRQSILDNGVDAANIKLVSKEKDGKAKISLQTVASAGSNIDKDALKKELAGKKKGEIQNILQDRPGVKEVDVTYSPFWVTKTPKSANKINIVLKSENANN